ncbi:hypothetical protein NG819_08035 [Pseudarthrobacter sp. Fe7]|nr:hypothetical protein NG819_08035 [Pseudarthrobacter sp. Fe7]
MRRILWWLAAASITTLVFGSVYVTLQQIGRHSANVAPAAAAAARLQQPGTDSTAGAPLDLTPDSGVFLIVYGDTNSPLSTTVTVGGSTPVVPPGVLDTARALGSDTVTWQPEPGLRMAIVAKQSAGKVVVAGQSLAPFEAADRMTMVFLGAGWLASMLVLAAAYWAAELMDRKQGRNPDGLRRE